MSSNQVLNGRQRRLQAWLLACLALGGVVCAAESDPAGAAVEALLAEHVEVDGPGAILVISRRGAAPRFYARGLASLEHGVPIKPDTRFHLASLSKQFTGLALALALQDGVLTLEESLCDFSGFNAQHLCDIRVEHLAYFSSGLAEYTDAPRAGGWPWFTAHYFDIDEAIGTALSPQAKRLKAGQKWQYRNINYMILTRLVAQRSRQAFADFVAARVFRPLAMHATAVHSDWTAVLPNRAEGYMRADAQLRGELQQLGLTAAPGAWLRMQRNAPHYGGSGVFSSARDWDRWVQEVFSHAHFGEAVWTRMLSNRAHAHGKSNDGLGLVMDRVDGAQTLWYAGNDIDSNTYMRVDVTHGTAVSCFANQARLDCAELTRRAWSLLWPD